MAIKIDDLAQAVAEELRAYRDEVVDGLKDSAKTAAKECLTAIKANSPADTGEYRAGWKIKKAYESGSDIRLQVYNKDHYQRTHLLEDGHANVDGGRTPGHPHIAPAADLAADRLEKEVKVKVGKK